MQTSSHMPVQPQASEPKRPDRRRRWRGLPAAQTPSSRVKIMGQDMDLLCEGDLMMQIDRMVGLRRRFLIANHNLHSLYLVTRTPEMAKMYERADVIQIDSVPLIRFARMTGHPAELAHRLTYLDWRDSFWTMAHNRCWRVFYLGGAPDVAQSAMRRLALTYPDITFEARDGFFDIDTDGNENRIVLKQIDDFQPDVLLVGMGMPRQEMWIAANMDALPPCVILPVGAAFDYEAGVQNAAPRWMGQWGLEWLYRLCSDPKRLASRYLYEPWFLLKPALRDLLRRR